MEESVREIKFRAFDEEKGKLTEPFRLGSVLCETYGGSKTLMQFTGRKDKNGREIYEGDITNYGEVRWFDDLNWDSGGSSHPGFYFVTKYGDLGDLQYHTGFDDCEVLGNRYENPELIESSTASPG